MIPHRVYFWSSSTMASSSRILGHGAGHVTADDGHSSSIGSISSSSRKRKFDLDPTESSQHKDTEPFNYDVLPYLNEPVSAFCLNWSQYVLDILMESCKKVQSAKYWSDKEKCTLDGCLIFLQIIYLDNLDFGS